MTNYLVLKLTAEGENNQWLQLHYFPKRLLGGKMCFAFGKLGQSVTICTFQF